MGYIGKHGIDELHRYKYSGVDRSYMAKYIFQPFWSRFVTIFPIWMSWVVSFLCFCRRFYMFWCLSVHLFYFCLCDRVASDHVFLQDFYVGSLFILSFVCLDDSVSAPTWYVSCLIYCLFNMLDGSLSDPKRVTWYFMFMNCRSPWQDSYLLSHLPCSAM